MSKTTARPSIEELTYIKKRAEQGASNGVIATELEFTCNTKRSEEEIIAIRAAQNLPKHDPEKIKQTVTNSLSAKFSKPLGTDEGESAVRGFSAAKASKTTRKKAPTLSADYVATAAHVKTVPDKSDARKIKVDFEPSFVRDCAPGKIYVYKGIGVMKCLGLEKNVIAGIDMETLVLKELFSLSPVTKRVQTQKFPANTIRELASPETMRAIVEKLEFGLSEIKSIPKTHTKRKDVFDKIMATADLNELADMLCFTYGKSRSQTLEDSGNVIRECSDKALKMIAAEYAQVTGQDFDKAHKMIREKSGRIKSAEAAPVSPPPGKPAAAPGATP